MESYKPAVLKDDENGVTRLYEADYSHCPLKCGQVSGKLDDCMSYFLLGKEVPGFRPAKSDAITIKRALALGYDPL